MGLFGSSISYLTFALALSLPILFLSRILAGIAGTNISKAQLNWQRLRTDLQHLELGVFLILFFFFISTFAFANLEATFALMTARRFGFDARANGYLFAYIGVLTTVVQGGFTGRLARRFGERRLISIGLFCMIFGLGLLPYSMG